MEDVTSHPKLARMAGTLAGIYDLKHSPELHEEMTFESPTSGEPAADAAPLEGAEGIWPTPERVRLFRLAWDLTGTQFGSRQTLYERFFNGDVVQLRMRRYLQYDYSRAEESVRRFMGSRWSS